MFLKQKIKQLSIEVLTCVELNRLKIFPSLFVAIFQFLYVRNNFGKLDFFSSVEESSMHFNILSTNAILAGFLFTGISILTSLSNKKIIMLLNKDIYLKLIYKSITYGIYAHIGSIFISFFAMLNKNKDIQPIAVNLQLTLLMVGIVYFLMAIWKLQNIIDAVRQEDARDGEMFDEENIFDEDIEILED